MQGHWSNSLGVDALKEPPYDVTTLFTFDPRAKMAEQPINSIENIKKADYEDRLRIKKAGRPKPDIDFEKKRLQVRFYHSLNNACLI